MDETPVTFDLPYSTTLDHRGTSTVNIQTTGHEKSNFTVILGCMADGTKLPAVCIFKLKNIPRESFPEGIFILVKILDYLINFFESIHSQSTRAFLVHYTILYHLHE